MSGVLIKKYWKFMDNSMRVHVKGEGRNLSRMIVRNRSNVEAHTPKGRVDIAIACINRLYVMEWKLNSS